MAITARRRFNSQELFTTADARSIENAVSADFDLVLRNFITGSSSAYIVSGFNINVDSNSFILAASNLTVNTSSAVVLHSIASESGTILNANGIAAESLSTSLNSRVKGSFTAGTVNYLALRLYRKADPNSIVNAKFWDAKQKIDVTKSVPSSTILDYQFVITTATPASTDLILATVTTDSNNLPTQITDNRPMLFRLGTGGLSPNPSNNFTWSQGRLENSYSSSSASTNPFYGGDKSIGTAKQWFDAVMSSLKEIKGSAYWYQLSSSGGSGGNLSLLTIDEDANHSYVTSTGSMYHNGSVTGDLYWDSQIYIRSVVSPQYYKIETLPSGTLTMSDGDVQFIVLNRYQSISNNVTLSPSISGLPANVTSAAANNGARIISGVSPQFQFMTAGASSDTGNGDWLKVVYDSNQYFRQAAFFFDNAGATSSSTNASYVVLDSSYLGSVGSQPIHYSQTYYPVSSITKKARASVLSAGNMGQIYWLGFRRADEVYTHFFGEMHMGEIRKISNETPTTLLTYIGSSNESVTIPNYAVTITGGSISITSGQVNYGGVSTDDLTTRVARLNSAIANNAQNKNVVLVGGGTVANAAGAVSWSTTATIIINGPSVGTFNTIAANTVSVTASNSCGYVTIDRNSQAVLNVSVTTFDKLPLTENTLVIIRTLNGNDVWVGVDGQAYYIATGSNSITGFTPASDASLGIANLHKWRQEKPSGSINGINASYTVSQTPYSATSTLIFKNGLFQTQGTSWDYTVTNSNTIIFGTAPNIGDELIAVYAQGQTVPYSYVQSLTTISVTTNNISFGSSPNLAFTSGVAVFLNGLQRQVNTDFTATATVVNFSFTLVPGNTVACFYTGVNDNLIAEQGLFNESATSGRTYYSSNFDIGSANSTLISFNGVNQFPINNTINLNSVAVNDYVFILYPQTVQVNATSLTTSTVMYCWTR